MVVLLFSFVPSPYSLRFAVAGLGVCLSTYTGCTPKKRGVPDRCGCTIGDRPRRKADGGSCAETGTG